MLITFDRQQDVLTYQLLSIIMSLKIGDVAPDFSLVSLTSDGPQVITLESLTAESNVLLLFVPMAFTGGCTEEFCAITKSLDAYKALDANVVGISGDNPFAQDAWAQKEGIGIPLLSDYEHKVTDAYGIAYESFIPSANLIMGGVSKRSAFVVDQAGKIQYAEVLENPGDMPDFDAIQECLKSL